MLVSGMDIPPGGLHGGMCFDETVCFHERDDLGSRGTRLGECRRVEERSDLAFILFYYCSHPYVLMNSICRKAVEENEAKRGTILCYDSDISVCTRTCF
jgi:hypothetical protein